MKKRAIACGVCSLFGGPAIAQDVATQAFTRDGATLTSAVQELQARAEAGNADARTHFAHALATFFRSGEHAVHQCYEYGAGQPLRGGTVFFMPGLMQIGANPDPKPVSADDVRRIVSDWLGDLERADDLFDEVPADQDWKLRLDMAQIPVDFNNDGVASPREEPARAFAIVFRNGVNLPQGQQSLVLGLDATDLHWLRAYNDVLMACANIVLAYDNQELFDRCGHLFFTKPITPFEFLQQRRPFDPTGMEFDVSDLLAFAGSLDFPLAEDGAQRMARARRHLLNAIAHHRAQQGHVGQRPGRDR